MEWELTSRDNTIYTEMQHDLDEDSGWWSTGFGELMFLIQKLSGVVELRMTAIINVLINHDMLVNTAHT